MSIYEYMSQGDLYELSLLTQAKNTIQANMAFQNELTPWKDEEFFNIPAYIREQAKQDIIRDEVKATLNTIREVYEEDLKF